MRGLRPLLLALGLVPWLAFGLSAGGAPSAVAKLGLVLRTLLSLQCHQLPERSFALAGCVMPVCARCLGLYSGIALAALLQRPQWRGGLLWAWVGLGCTVLALDAATEALGMRPPSPLIRALTGGLCAYGIALRVLRRHAR